jgi:DNA invertase Pin-like site-specific DNA recombinase
MNKLSKSINNCNISNISNNKSEKAYIYIRSSTKRQNDEFENQHSFATQKKECIDYCRENNYIINEIIEETCSGTKTDKLKINNILLKKNIHLVVSDPSRISRELDGGSRILRKCIDSNIIIHSVRDHIRSDTLSGERHFIDLFYEAYRESQNISKRINANIKVRKNLNSKFGIAPYGQEAYNEIYNINGSKYNVRKFRENINEQKIITLIKKLYNGSDKVSFYTIFRKFVKNPDYILINEKGDEWNGKKCSCSDITKYLNKSQILKRGKHWNKSSIARIIKDNKKIKKNQKSQKHESDDDNNDDDDNKDDNDNDDSNKMNYDDQTDDHNNDDNYYWKNPN